MPRCPGTASGAMGVQHGSTSTAATVEHLSHTASDVTVEQLIVFSETDQLISRLA